MTKLPCHYAIYAVCTVCVTLHGKTDGFCCHVVLWHEVTCSQIPVWILAVCAVTIVSMCTKFGERGSQVWNAVPQNIRHKTSPNYFKRHFKIFLICLAFSC